MRKETKITQDKTQTRAKVPKEFVDELKITKKDVMQWEMKDKKIKGELKKQ